MLEQLRSQGRLAQFLDLASELERDGILDRALHRLPDKETMRRRRGTYLGLTRPELAVLLAHVKLSLQHKLLASSLPDDPYAERYLQRQTDYISEVGCWNSYVGRNADPRAGDRYPRRDARNRGEGARRRA